MKRRFQYLLLFGLPALLMAGMAALLLVGAAAGVLWLFVFGDNPWPAAAEKVLGAGFFIAWLALWLVLLVLAFAAGKRQEASPRSMRGPVMLALGTLALVVFVAVLHQRSVGNLGPPSDGELCLGYCADKGFSGSSMPPRNAGLPRCSCLDGSGRETAPVTIEEIARTRRR